MSNGYETNQVTPPARGDDPAEARLASCWGQRVGQARRAAGMSQHRLAQAVGVTQQTISKIELGDIIPLDKLKLRLAAHLGREPGDLFAWPP